jgi:hypothetical protein
LNYLPPLSLSLSLDKIDVRESFVALAKRRSSAKCDQPLKEFFALSLNKKIKKETLGADKSIANNARAGIDYN